MYMFPEHKHLNFGRRNDGENVKKGINIPSPNKKKNKITCFDILE